DKMFNKDSSKMAMGRLESKLDLLEAELFYVDHLLRRVGFPAGIETLKAAAEELLVEQQGTCESH
ncbi:MAG: hypothetical protein AAF443_08965, partial [Chlamydiota bacterium]